MNTQVQQNETNNTQETTANETELLRNFNPEDVKLIGIQAVKDWKSGENANGRGDQRAIYACALAWNELEFLAVIETKTGMIEEQWTFDLEHYMNSEPKKEDGKRDNKKSQAQHRAVFSQLFGIEEPTSNQKQRVKSALQVVSYLYETLGFDETDILWNEKSSRLEVPYVALEDEPKEDADEEAKKTYEAMKGNTVPLSGKRGRAVADLQRRAKPKVERAAQSQTGDKGASFLSSAKLVDTSLSLILDESSKDAIAVTEEMEAILWAISQRLARYFEAFEPSDAEKEQYEAKMNGTTGAQAKAKAVVKNTRASKG